MKGKDKILYALQKAADAPCMERTQKGISYCTQQPRSTVTLYLKDMIIDGLVDYSEGEIYSYYWLTDLGRTEAEALRIDPSCGPTFYREYDPMLDIQSSPDYNLAGKLDSIERKIDKLMLLVR